MANTTKPFSAQISHMQYVAKQLGYGNEVVERLGKAENMTQAQNIMIDARRKSD